MDRSQPIDDQVTSTIESRISRFNELERQAFKIGMTSNGIALALSVAAYSRLSNLEIEITKFPLWAFFTGLVIGGIIIIFRVISIFVESESENFKNRDAGRTTISMLENHPALKKNPELKQSADELKEMLQNIEHDVDPAIESAFNDFPNHDVIFTNFIRALLLIQYCLFMVGVASAIASL